MLVAVLEGGSLAFTILLVNLEIHSMLVGRLSTPPSGLLEATLLSDCWLAMAVLMHFRAAWASRPVVIYGSRILVGLGLLELVFVALLFRNPIWAPEPVGDTAIFNLLLLAYLLPAGLIVAYCWLAPVPAHLRLAGAGLGLLLGFTFISLEVRRSFHGSYLAGPTSVAEWYSYSAAWLCYAGLLLLLGIRAQNAWLRYASLFVLLLAVGKAFLFDMSNLAGLYRVASFIGLGLSLIGIGYLYQRFVLPIAPFRHT